MEYTESFKGFEEVLYQLKKAIVIAIRNVLFYI
jgi:hypothetical protein